ncbi:MAG: hypothetical protein JSW17_03445 [Candidatus Omnitrophota bacterium]|nr:MAG: hypothetical protein JSW17_03445 [Candidatus Omnitrophota bacterium]
MSITTVLRHRKAQTVVEYALLTAISLVAVLGLSSYISRIKSGSAIKDHFDQVTRHIKGR